MSYYSTDNARRSLLHTATFRITSQAATLASYVVLVRAMSEHDFGVFNLLYAIIPVVSTIASLGVEQVLRRFEPMYLQERRFQLAAWLVRTAAWLRASSNLVILALILLLWQWLAPVFRIGPYRAEFVLFSLIVDKFGYGKTMVVAFLFHMGSILLTIFAWDYNSLWWATILFALGNGTVEAVINPVTATLYPNQKTHYLNILHAGWPGGLVLGGKNNRRALPF